MAAEVQAQHRRLRGEVLPGVQAATSVELDRGAARLAWPVAGQCLRHSIDRVRSLNHGIKRRVAADLAEAVALLHSQGLSHGALTPEMVWLGEGQAAGNRSWPGSGSKSAIRWPLVVVGAELGPRVREAAGLLSDDQANYRPPRGMTEGTGGSSQDGSGDEVIDRFALGRLLLDVYAGANAGGGGGIDGQLLVDGEAVDLKEMLKTLEQKRFGLRGGHRAVPRRVIASLLCQEPHATAGWAASELRRPGAIEGRGAWKLAAAAGFFLLLAVLTGVAAVQTYRQNVEVQRQLSDREAEAQRQLGERDAEVQRQLDEREVEVQRQLGERAAEIEAMRDSALRLQEDNARLAGENAALRGRRPTPLAPQSDRPTSATYDPARDSTRVEQIVERVWTAWVSKTSGTLDDLRADIERRAGGWAVEFPSHGSQNAGRVADQLRDRLDEVEKTKEWSGRIREINFKKKPDHFLMVRVGDHDVWEEVQIVHGDEELREKLSRKFNWSSGDTIETWLESNGYFSDANIFHHEPEGGPLVLFRLGTVGGMSWQKGKSPPPLVEGPLMTGSDGDWLRLEITPDAAGVAGDLIDRLLR